MSRALGTRLEHARRSKVAKVEAGGETKTGTKTGENRGQSKPFRTSTCRPPITWSISTYPGTRPRSSSGAPRLPGSPVFAGCPLPGRPFYKREFRCSGRTPPGLQAYGPDAETFGSDSKLSIGRNDYFQLDEVMDYNRTPCPHLSYTPATSSPAYAKRWRIHRPY
jgi:hypothetical protein